jgi:hypothetical protein
MLPAALILMFLGSGAQQAPLPTIQNGKVETRQATSLDREIATARPLTSDDERHRGQDSVREHPERQLGSP